MNNTPFQFTRNIRNLAVDITVGNPLYPANSFLTQLR